MKFANKTYTLQLLLTAFFLGISLFVSYFFNDLIPKNNGLGWDGVMYATLVKDFPSYITEINDSNVKRFLPPLIGYLLFFLSKMEPTNGNVILYFQALASVFILISTHLTYKISEKLKFPNHVSWLVYFLVIVSFATLKFPFFYATSSMDVLGFTFSLGLLYYFLEGRKGMILLLLLVGMCSWPATLYFALPLLVFKKEQLNVEKIGHGMTPLYKIAAILIAGAFIAMSAFIIYTFPQTRGFSSGAVTSLMNTLTPLSLGLTFITLLYLLLPLAKQLPKLTLGKVLKSIDKKYLLMGVIAYIATGVAYSAFSRYHQLPHVLGLKEYLWNILVNGSRYPLCFIGSHLLFFGPIVLLALLFWKKVAHKVLSYGFGMLILFFLGIILAMDAETRHLVGFVPFLGFIAVDAVKEHISKSRSIVLIVVAILLSRFWMPLQSFIFDNWKENYFFNLGNMQDDKMYLISAVILCITSVLLSSIFKSNLLEKKSA